MLVGITGATGFIGAHAVRALLEAGHDVRLLALPDEDLHDALPGVGVDPAWVEVVRGDLRSQADVEALLDGIDALVHAAGIVSVDDRLEDLMWEVNVHATSHLLHRATALGLEAIVHLASISALLPSADEVIGPDTPTAEARTAYGRTKAEGDRIARRLQDRGAPIAILYPSGVVGPPAGSRRGLTADGWDPIARFGVAPTFDGGFGMVDVRDVADLVVAALRPGAAPGRYVCGGEDVGFDQMVDAVAEALGRRVRRIPVPGRLLRLVGRVNDLLCRFLPVTPTLGHEAAWMLTTRVVTDDRAALHLLGRAWRPVHDAFVDGVRGTLALASPSAVAPAATRPERAAA